MSSKTCRVCGATKPLTAFYAHRQMRDGHLNQCKACSLAQNRLNRRNPEYRARERQRSKRPERVALRKRWEAANPEKVRAHKAVYAARRRGRLVPEPCEFCGNPETVAHHDDYSRPLDVRWLCRSCHGLLHAGELA